MSSGQLPERDQSWWWERLLVTNPWFRRGRALFKHLPSDPRCKLCAAPFEGSAAPLMRLFGKRRWPRNPKYCASCFKNIEKHRGGAEIESSFLFADVRGSTPLAEQMSPTEFRALMDRFFATASQVLVEHDAIVDKFVGDEVIGIFLPGIAGDDHAAQAIAAARALMAATGNTTRDPWVAVGAGVNRESRSLVPSVMEPTSNSRPLGIRSTSPRGSPQRREAANDQRTAPCRLPGIHGS